MKQAPIPKALSKKYPEPVVLVISCDKKGKANIITLGWSMQTSSEPPMLAISVSHKRYSHQLISEQKEFVLCFPTSSQIEGVLFCGTHSGRDVNKFKETKLKPQKAKYVKPPLIKDSLACFECKVVDKLKTGDHTIFVGEIKTAYISEKPKKRIYSLDKGHKLGSI